MGILGISALNLVWVGFASSFWQAAVTGGLAFATRAVPPGPSRAFLKDSVVTSHAE